MNRRCIYLVEGECEEKLINALKKQSFVNCWSDIISI